MRFQRAVRHHSAAPIAHLLAVGLPMPKTADRCKLPYQATTKVEEHPIYGVCFLSQQPTTTPPPGEGAAAGSCRGVTAHLSAVNGTSMCWAFPQPLDSSSSRLA